MLKINTRASGLARLIKFTLPLTLTSTLLLASPFSAAQVRNVNVHLFEWKWNDIKRECAYLQEKGYGSVQVSPPNEHVVKDNHPWWQRYQPVSYQLTRSRSGTLDEFRSMVETCWKQHGVKIYVDAVINHMAEGHGVGSSGTAYQNASNYFLYRKDGQDYFYNASDFHPRCSIDWGKDPVPADEIRRCWIEGSLPDLVTEDAAGDRVKTRIADFLNSMIDMGVAGFRIDAAKHMHPADIVNINNRLKNLRSDAGWFATGERPFIYQEVIWGAKQEVTPEQYQTQAGGKRLNITEFRYGTEIGKKFRETDGRISDFLNFNFPIASAGWGMVDSAHAFVFVDNHDNQRGHGSGYFTAGGNNAIGGILTHYYDGALYNLANVFMLAWPYGSPQVMSSYGWQRDVRWDGKKFRDFNDWMGPPSDTNGNTNTADCTNGWVCEHRWNSIAGMVGFNNYTQDAWGVGYKWSDGGRKIGFARVKSTGVSSGYVLINRDGTSINTSIRTGLPAGVYCDVAQGSFNFVTRQCAGPTIEVNSSGYAQFNLGAMQASAIHVGAPGNTTPAKAYFRGTPNGFGLTEMTPVTGGWETTQTFGSDNPRFKVCLSTTWDNCFPAADFPVTQGAGSYHIRFDAANRAITLTKVNTPNRVNVSFTCDNGQTTSGISVYVVGSSTELGNWKVLRIGQKLNPTQYPRWTGSVELESGRQYTWKCVKARESDFGITEWQGGADNLLDTRNQTSATGRF